MPGWFFFNCGCCAHKLEDSDGVVSFYYDAEFLGSKRTFHADDCTNLAKERPSNDIELKYNDIIGRDLVDAWYDGAPDVPVMFDPLRAELLERSPLIEPQKDARFKDRATAHAYLERYFRDRVPPSAAYPDAESDEALIDFCSLHCGVFNLVKNDDDNYEIDLLYLKDFKIRKGFNRYGAKAVFDSEMKKILSIELVGTKKVFTPPNPKKKTLEKDTEAWKVAKCRFLSTLICSFTAREHLIEVHFCVANELAIHTRRLLSYNNPLRILLEPFQFNTPKVNKAAATSLFAPGGILERTFPFEQGEFKKIAAEVNKSYKAATPHHIVERNGLEDLENLPIAKEACEYYDACRRFVVAFLKSYPSASRSEDSTADETSGEEGDFTADMLGGDFADEAAEWEEGMREVLDADEEEMDFVDVVAFTIYTVTGMHEAIGTMGFDLLWMCPSATVKGNTLEEILPPKNTLYMAFILAALTSKKMPMLVECQRIWTSESTKAAVDAFFDDIKQISKNTAKYNKKRRRAIPAFDPVLFEVSVSV